MSSAEDVRRMRGENLGLEQLDAPSLLYLLRERGRE